ncbi:MAG: RNA polymerase sigma-70 factor [Chitinophagaceae bacterium]
MTGNSHILAGYQLAKVEQSNAAIIRSLAPTGEAAFEQLFKTHFRGLHAYAITILKDEMMGEEIVQNVFFKVWEKRQLFEIETSPKAYLYKAVYHDCLNYLKHKKVKSVHAMHVVRQSNDQVENASGKLLQGELKEHIHNAMNELPEQCRTIFQMSRFEGLKYQEIADEMGLSVKTIENQMGKALKLLRLKLVDFLPFFILSLISI